MPAVKGEEPNVAVSEQTYRQVALEDPEGHWELHCGRLRKKTGMTEEHNEVAGELYFQLRLQLEREEFQVRSNAGHVRRSAQNYYIPDVFVVPTELAHAQRGTHALEVYDAPLPLVIEVWSRSTGDYDVDAKLPAYQRRGDLEIWRVHPYEHTLIAWRRQPDGTYTETLYSGGTVEPVALPNVTVDLDVLFD
jgi:Uma2 family endonuclease